MQLKRRIAKAILLLLIPALVVASLIPLVGAQADCAGYECIDVSNFDADLDGWQVGNSMTLASWIESETFNFSFDPDYTAYGVSKWELDPTYVPGQIGVGLVARKSVMLDPGTYMIILNVGQHLGWWQHPVVQVAVKRPNSQEDQWLQDIFDMPRGMETLQTNEFTVDRDVAVDITVSSSADYNGISLSEPAFFMDYIWLVKISDAYPTLVPGTPTRPFPSTPLPVPTEVCQQIPPTPTQSVPGFSLTPSPTPAATATPMPDADVAFIDTFTGSMATWWTKFDSPPPDRIYHTLIANHTRGSSGSMAGALQIGYSADADFTNRRALIISFSDPITETIYSNGWAQPLESVPQGTTAYAEVWVLDAVSLTWSLVDQFSISPGYWYPFHSVITSTNSILAVAFAASRSDDDDTHSLLLDDISVYGSLSQLPYCNGVAPGSVPGGPGDTGGTGTDTTTIPYPTGKACPADLTVPNNFWGPLLAQLTIFLDQLFAFMPSHTPGLLSAQTHDLLSGPLVSFITVASVFFDLRLPLALVGLFLTIQGGRALWSMWLAIKKSIPFVG